MRKSFYAVAVALVLTVVPGVLSAKPKAPKVRFLNVETTSVATTVVLRYVEKAPKVKSKTLGEDIAFGETTKLRKVFPPGDAQLALFMPGIAVYMGPQDLSFAEKTEVLFIRHDTTPYGYPLVETITMDALPTPPLEKPLVQLLILDWVADLSPLKLEINIPGSPYSQNLAHGGSDVINLAPGTYPVDIIDPGNPSITQYSADITVLPKQLNVLVLMGTKNPSDDYPLMHRLLTNGTKR